MHLQFTNPDGSLEMNLDVDVSPPSLPVGNIDDYDGSNTKKRAWLLKHSNGNKLGTRSVRLRRMNRNLVIPELVSIENIRFNHLNYVLIYYLVSSVSEP